jgi:hypothetical protein
LFPELLKINAEIRLFNTGFDYFVLRKTPLWQDNVIDRTSGRNDDEVASEGAIKGKNIQYFGVIGKEKVGEELKQAMGVFHLVKGKTYEGKGVFNYTDIEAMKYGATVLAFPDILGGNSPLSDKEVYVIDKQDIAGSINAFLDNEMKRKEIAKNALDYVRNNHDNVKEVEKMLKLCLK